MIFLEKSYSIGEVAKILKVNVKTLYYYDRQGLFPFVKRDQQGNRIFTTDNLEMILTILHLKNAGVKLKEIREFINWRMEGDSTLEKRLSFIQDQENILKNKIQELQRAFKILEYKEWYYQTAVEAGTEKVHLIPGTLRYNQEAAEKFVNESDKMSEVEKELFEIEELNSQNQKE